MPKVMKYLLLIVIIFSATIGFAEDNLDEIIRKHPRLNIAIQVKNLKTGQEIYSHNSNKLLIPASVTKSFTTYAALEYLGADFIYDTQVLFNKNQINSDGTLLGDLYIKFSGDPSLSKEEFSKLIASLKQYNIKAITGNIILDDSMFDQAHQADGWSSEDSKFCFNAPASAIVINKNCFYLNLSPAKTIGKITELKGYSVAKLVENKIITKDDMSCSPELKAESNNIYRLSGCLDAKSKDLPLSIAYQDPRLMMYILIKNLLKEQLIKHKEIYFLNTIPPEYQVMLEHKSAPLSMLIKQMHKDSDNIAANNISKTIGAYYYKTQGNFTNGSKAIEEILASKTKINFSEMRIIDGSGSSRYNLIAPDHLVNLFYSAYHNSKVWANFQESLPIIGIDGTLAKRLIDNSELHGKILAKTGYMTGVATISGYILEKDLVFAVMINGYVGPRNELHKLVDQILITLLK